MTIKEVAKLTGVSSDNLRYYERIKIIPPIPRNASGIRNYDELSIRWIFFVKKMKAAGMSLDTIIDYLALVQGGDKTKEARKQLLQEVQQSLEEKMKDLQTCLDLTKYKIEHYDTLCGPVSEEIVNAWLKEN